jgi:hypothetical protein
MLQICKLVNKFMWMNDDPLYASFRVNDADREYQVWERNPLSIELYSPHIFLQKLHYIHRNPLQGKWNFATVVGRLTNNPHHGVFCTRIVYQQEGYSFSGFPVGQRPTGGVWFFLAFDCIRSCDSSFLLRCIYLTRKQPNTLKMPPPAYLPPLLVA